MSDTTNDRDLSSEASAAAAGEPAVPASGESAEATETTIRATGTKKAAPRKRAAKKTADSDAAPKRRRRATAPAGPGGDLELAYAGEVAESAASEVAQSATGEGTEQTAEQITDGGSGEHAPGESGAAGPAAQSDLGIGQVADAEDAQSETAADPAAADPAAADRPADDGEEVAGLADGGTSDAEDAEPDAASDAATDLVADRSEGAETDRRGEAMSERADGSSALQPASDEPESPRPQQSAFGLLFQAPEAPARRRASRPAGAAVTVPSSTTPSAAADGSGAEHEVVLDREKEPAATEDESRSVGAGRGSRRGSRRAGATTSARNAALESAAAQSADGENARENSGARSADIQNSGARAGDDDSAEKADVDPAEGAETDAADDGSATGSRSRRRRGGRGRRARANSSDAEGAEADEALQASEASAQEEGSERHTDAGEAADDDANNPARRRRRRRRSGAAGESEDPPGTVTRVREVRRARDEVASVRGSTRLEAKKQRRREGREAGRRRTIITEKEFLARRESVERVMVVRRLDGRTQIGVLEDGILVEHYVSRTTNASMAGNIYLGRVQNVLPSMEAAFVDIGRGRNAVLYAGEVNWDVAGLETGEAKRIENVLTSGESVLVQVTKDPIGHKGARLTSQISLPGRYLVYVPQGSMTGISRKLPDTERARLKAILKEIVPADAGVIVRTAAEGASEEELRRDVERLAKTWERVSAAAAGKSGKKTGNAPTLLYSEPDLTVRVIRDVFNEDFASLVVSGDDVWAEISTYVDDVAPDLAARMTKWTDARDIFSAHRIDEQMTKALDRKVYLPSGGSLVIDRTEAMTVVDVNTGKFVGSGGNLEETVTKNNLEAAEEIVRQLRLRDIGGIIVIDFIDMVLESNRDLVVRRLLECLGRDRTKHQVAEVTSLGLVQMTRKRVASGLLEVFSESCEHCHGRGVIVRTTPVDAVETHDHEREPSDTSSRSSRSRSRGRQPDPAKAPEPAPVRTGPTAAQIAAAAHAAAMKTTAPVAHNDADVDGAPADDTDFGMPAATVAHDADSDPVVTWADTHDADTHEEEGSTDAEAARDQGAGTESAQAEPDHQAAAESDDSAAQLPAGDDAGAENPDAALGAEGDPSAIRQSGSGSRAQGRRRRGRATAPAGPPRPSGS